MDESVKQKILDKLDLKERGASFILENEVLCQRILTEDVIWTEDFIKKYGVSKQLLEKFMKNGTLSYFSNYRFRKGCKNYLFEKEAVDFYQDGMYNNGFASAYNRIAKMLIEISKKYLNKEELKAMEMLLVAKCSYRQIALEFGMDRNMAANLILNAKDKLKRYLEKQEELKVMEDKIANLKYLELVIKNNIEEEKENLPKELKGEENLDKLTQYRIEDIDCSSRLANILEMANIKSLYELTLIKRSHLLKYRNFGTKTLRELDEIMEEHGLCFRPEIEKTIKLNIHE